MKIVGILGAMPEEINEIVALLDNKQEVIKGMRTYYLGRINDVAVVVVFSRWGKVASATTVTHLIVEFGITELYFTGVAGAIRQDLNIGDVVIANSLVQHDLDARPIMKQFEIPLLGKTILYPPKDILEKSIDKIKETVYHENFLYKFSPEQIKLFSISKTKVFVGQIASGDKFFSNGAEKESLLKVLPDLLCVEMEGAAVAQVCFEYGIPFVVIRIISDTADESSPIDFKEFIAQIASKYVVEIIKNIIE